MEICSKRQLKQAKLVFPIYQCSGENKHEYMYIMVPNCHNKRSEE